MRRQKSGIIVNISSALGRFGLPIHSAYESTKFAVEGLSESMAYELESFGVKVVLIEPGFIKTNALNNAKKFQDAIFPAYAKHGFTH
jgi:NAD(P)-dependent dehydrogenase (short-subunit alcohol dehydrogenase family)